MKTLEQRIPYQINAEYLIGNLIEKAQPAAIGKIGGTEGKALAIGRNRFVRTLRPSKVARRMQSLYELSGVYPNTPATFDAFIDFFGGKILPEVDYLAKWRGEDDEALRHTYGLKAEWLPPETLSTLPERWWLSLRGKRVVVISPFKASLLRQIDRLAEVWPRGDLPLGSGQVRIIQSPFHAHLAPPRFDSWFESLKHLEQELAREPYDVMLVGAGAWSLPLCVAAKRSGRVGIHLGGVLQLLFGIVGSRWNKDKNPIRARSDISSLFNDSWIAPDLADTPEAIKRASSLFRADCQYW